MARGPGIIGKAMQGVTFKPMDKLKKKGLSLKGAFGKLIPAFDTLINKAFGAESTIGKVAGALTKVAQGFMTGGPIGAGVGLLSSFAGFFQHGGTIPSGQFGIVGESGPEPVAGPATVFPDTDSLVSASGGGGGVSLDPTSMRDVTKWALANDPAWQEAVDATLQQNENSGGKMSEYQKRGGRR